MSNIVKGSVLTLDLPVFTGSFRNAKLSHHARVKVVVLKESYGKQAGQHTFTTNILESDDPINFKVGSNLIRKGRNLYPNLVWIEQPENYEEVAEDKKRRAETQSAMARKPHC
jgi:hypothetical protein